MVIYVDLACAKWSVDLRGPRLSCVVSQSLAPICCNLFRYY